MPKFPENPSPAMYKSSGFKMKNSALYKSAKHGSPMQQNYDNTLHGPQFSDQSFNNSFNKKDFVNTIVKKGITVPKKTTQENLTRNQNQVPSEGGRGNTTTTTTTTKKFKKEGRDKVKEQHGPKWQMHEINHEKVKHQKPKNKVKEAIKKYNPYSVVNKINKGIKDLIFKK